MYELKNGEQYTIRAINGVVTLDHWKAGMLKPVKTQHDTPGDAFQVFAWQLNPIDIAELKKFQGVELIPDS